MSGKSYLNQHSVTYPSISTQPLHLNEFVDRSTEDTKRHQTKKQNRFSGSQTKTENEDDDDNASEEESNEVCQSGTENGLNSTGEIGKEKHDRKNSTPIDKCSTLDSKNGSYNESEKNANGNSTSKENFDITERERINYYTERLSSTNENKNYSNKSNSGNKNNGDGKKDKNALKEIGLFALKTAAISGAVLGGTALIVPAIGFGALGVTGGSLAAAYQSAVLGGTIASGSAFATLQSVGMAGLPVVAKATVVAGSAVTSGIHSIWKNLKKKKDKSSSNSDVILKYNK